MRKLFIFAPLALIHYFILFLSLWHGDISFTKMTFMCHVISPLGELRNLRQFGDPVTSLRTVQFYVSVSCSCLHVIRIRSIIIMIKQFWFYDFHICLKLTKSKGRQWRWIKASEKFRVGRGEVFRLLQSVGFYRQISFPWHFTKVSFNLKS